MIRGDLASAGKNLEEAVSKLSSQSEKQMQETIKKASAAQVSSRMLIILTALISLFLSVILGLLITRTITQPLRKVSDYLNWESKMEQESRMDRGIGDDISETMRQE